MSETKTPDHGFTDEETHAPLAWTTDIIYTFSDAIPNDVEGLAVQLHTVAGNALPVNLHEIQDILSRGMGWLHEDESAAQELEQALNDAGISLPARLKDLIMIRSVRMDAEGKKLFADNKGLMDKITQEVSQIDVLRVRIQSDRELVLSDPKIARKTPYSFLYGQIDSVLDSSKRMVGYGYYLQELMRAGHKSGKLTGGLENFAHDLDSNYLRDRGFIGTATINLLKQGVRVHAPTILE